MRRRAFVGLTLSAGSAALVSCMDDDGALADDDPILAGTCTPTLPDDGCVATPPDIEGPYYVPDAPERSELDTVGDDGVPLALSGYVREVGCAPLADVLVEIWHADPHGAYDDSPGMNYRGWVRTDAEGHYAFSTLVPGRYLNGDTLRPAHIHVKVWREGVVALTTQIYFADDPHAETDPWADPARTSCITLEAGGVAAVFDIALIAAP